MRKFISKVWDTFLIASFYLSAIQVVFWTCCLDDDSIIPTIGLWVNAGWLLLLLLANDPYRKGKTHETKIK